MKIAFRIYSDVLQGRRETLAALLHSKAGVAFAFKLFIVVMLIAGLGRWFGIPVLIRQPVLSEVIQGAGDTVEALGVEVTRTVDDVLYVVSEEHLSQSLNQAIEDLVAQGIDITATSLSQALVDAGLTPAQLEQALAQVAAAPERFAVTADEIEAAQAQLAKLAESDVLPPEAIDQVLADLQLTPAQLTLLLDRVQSDLATTVNQSQTQVGQTAAGMESLLAQISLTKTQIEARLTDLIAAPLHDRRFFSRLGLSQEQIAWVDAQLKEATTRVNQTIDQVQAEVEQLEPPLGARTSRVIHLMGSWISTPFIGLTQWLFFALFALLVAKLLGGRATAAQHLAAFALATAPAVLLLITFIPVMSHLLFISYSMAIHYFGRVLAVIAIGWSVLILLKTLAVAHDFSLWKSAGALVLTWLVIWVIVPAASLAALAYVWGG